MYKTLTTLLAVFLLANTSIAQKHDYVWLGGYDSHVGIRDSNRTYGITKLDFNYAPVDVSYDSIGINFSRALCTMADYNGNLIFYSNGNYIANKWDVPIENSDSLSFGWLSYVWDPDVAIDGQRYPRSNIAIPRTHNNHEYIFFNLLIDTFQNKFTYVNTKLYATTIDVDGNFGMGSIIEKKRILIDSIIGNELIVVKHANGRDWWLMGCLRNTKCFFVYLITPQGYFRQPNQCVATYINTPDDLAYGGMSPDGNKIATISMKGGLSLYDFDRCSGVISNPVEDRLPEISTNVLLGISVSFSPNSRFLYVSATDRIYQYDTWSQDVIASKDTVAWYDGFKDINLQTLFSNSQLAPDGKIYLSTGNTTRYYHVIENPDEKGLNCNVRQHSLKLKSYNGGIPYYPNYRLGALVGSGCDTLISNITPNPSPRERGLTAFPNPSIDVVTIDYGNIIWERYKEVKLQVANATGQVVYSSALPRYSGIHKVNVSSLPSGIYHAEVYGDNNLIGVSKVMKE